MASIWFYVGRLVTVYSWAILVYIVLSWFASGATGALRGVYRGLAAICEPFLSLFRRLLPPVMVGSAGLDLSPIIALFLLQLLGNVVSRL
ncbi:MAG TPA: YggT family protein [Coriobacteriia bacterium]